LVAQRQALRIGVDEQARRLGLSLQLLARLALCRTPRPGHFHQDLERVAAFTGVSLDALQQLLADADPAFDLGALGRAVDLVRCAVCIGTRWTPPTASPPARTACAGKASLLRSM
jgi:hypothetical protein